MLLNPEQVHNISNLIITITQTTISCVEIYQPYIGIYIFFNTNAYMEVSLGHLPHASIRLLLPTNTWPHV